MLCSSFMVTGLKTSIDPGLVAVDGTVFGAMTRFTSGPAVRMTP
jgi:hypothetical protein